jgi:branched-chain amino acid transport system permease protein
VSEMSLLHRLRRMAPRLALIGVCLLLPLYVTASWLQLGLFAMAATVAAVGLVLLTGAAGQISLGHAFFLAVGSYSYAFFSGTGEEVQALGLPPLAGAVLAVALTGFCGLLISPMAGRLKGIYLGIATLGLVFLGQHLLLNLEHLTGGFAGVSIPVFSVAGLEFSDRSGMVVLGTPLGAEEMLWYLFVAVTWIAMLLARNIMRGRSGRAFRFMRDSEIGAAAMGVNIRRTKSAAFVVSSMYAGLGGVLTGLAFQRVVPDYFSLLLSIDFLAMVILGGLVSVTGAAIGATFVVVLPLLLETYGAALPLIAAPGQSGGLDASVTAQLVYGSLVVIVMIVQPKGLAGAWQAVVDRSRRHRHAPEPASPTRPQSADRTELLV